MRRIFASAGSDMSLDNLWFSDNSPLEAAEYRFIEEFSGNSRFGF